MAALFTPAASSVSKLMLQGRQSAAAIQALLQDAHPTEHGEIRELAAEICRCCDRALATLHGGGDGAVVDADHVAGGRKRKSGAAAQTRPNKRTAKRVEKKLTSVDGFMWRKYGQKDILNSKHPRLYFRCSYRDDSGCPATRQVQLSEEEPSLYVITYIGDHTCCADIAAATSGIDDEEKQPFVINFGSDTASGGSPPWLSSSSDNGDGRSETSCSSSLNGCLPEGGDAKEELQAKVTRIEPTSSDLQPATEQSSSSDASCPFPPWDPLVPCSVWDCFDETSFDYSELFNFDCSTL